MAEPSHSPQRWTPALVATMVVRFVGGLCLIFSAFWIINWFAYRVEYAGNGMSGDQDAYYVGAILRYLVLGGVLILFEPAFARWLAGGRLGSERS